MAKKDRELLRWYRQEMRRSVKARKTHLKAWKYNEKATYDDSFADQDDSPRVDKLGSFMEARVAAIAFRNPRIKIRPRRDSGWDPVSVPLLDPETGPVMEPVLSPEGMPLMDPITGQPQVQQVMRQVPRFKILEHTVNYFMSRPSSRAAASGRLCVKSGLMTGVGVLRVGFQGDYEEPEDDGVLPLPLEQAVYQDVEWLRKNYEFADTGEPMLDSQQHLVPKGQIPISELFFIDWDDSKQMLFDPDGENDMTRHRYVAHEEWVHLDEVKKNKLYSGTSDLKATGRKGHSEHDPESHDLDVGFDFGMDPDEVDSEQVDMVHLYHIWDFVRDKYVVMAEGHDSFLRNEEIPDGVCKRTGPFAYYRPIEIPSKWYGKAPVTNLRKQSRFVDETNRQLKEEMRKASVKILVDSEILTPENIEQLNSPNREVIVVDTTRLSSGKTLQDAVFPIVMPTVSAQLFAFKQEAERDFDESAGQPAQSRGQSTGGTATEVNALQGREFMREEYQRSVYMECWLDAATKFVDTLQTNMTQEQAITVNEGDGVAWSMNITPEMIQGDFDIEISIEELEPANKQQDRANLVNLLTIVGQAPFLAADEQAFEGITEMFSMSDRRIAKGVSAMAQMTIAAMMAPAQPEKPGTGAAENEADAISKQGGGVMYGG